MHVGCWCNYGNSLIKVGSATGSENIALETQEVTVGADILTHRHLQMDQASRVFVRTFVLGASIRFSRFPVHVLMGEPRRFHVHSVKYSGEAAPACRGDFTAAGFQDGLQSIVMA